MWKKKPVERICKNCRLFNPVEQLCMVAILHEGEKIHLPVLPQDTCFFEQEYFNPITNEKEDFNHINEIKFWVENEKGEKIDGKGKIVMEAPESLFKKPT